MKCAYCGSFVEWPRPCQHCKGEMCLGCLDNHECPNLPEYDDEEDDGPRTCLACAISPCQCREEPL